MAKAKTVYVCSACAAEYPRWSGQCIECKAWNTLQEQTIAATPAPSKLGASRANAWTGTVAAGRVQTLAQVGHGQAVRRLPTGIGEFNRVLGGDGVVVGSVVLIGGEPGIGKSTLLIQAMAAMGAHARALYVAGEESGEQVADRARRLGLNLNHVHILPESEINAVLAHLDQEKPAVVVVDSIQTMYSELLTSAAGTVSQVRECAMALNRYAKRSGCAVFLVGHVTKDGSIAGPRVLEHLVDTVLYFEGDPQSPYRLVRSIKNRFGAANELGAFEMTGEGLLSVDNPSAMFLAQDRRISPGSCVVALQEGPRPILIEVQALMDDCVGNQPQRRAVGVDPNRMAMLLAVLHKHAALDVGTLDVFLNAVGGIKAHETAADLALLLAMVSSLLNKALPTELACFGEVGLNGEVRPVQRADDRLREMAKLGQTLAIVPQRNLPKKAIGGLRVIGVSNIAEAIQEVSELWVPLPAVGASGAPKGSGKSPGKGSSRGGRERTDEQGYRA
jgi:DNA repair protein RadA/Sms